LQEEPMSSPLALLPLPKSLWTVLKNSKKS
jgi:hypothetical protein